jgi:hypothetical protein
LCCIEGVESEKSYSRMILALVERGGKVSCGKAWCTLEDDNVRTYSI